MLYYDRIYISEGIDLTKSNKSKECKMVDIMGIYKSLNISIATVLKNPTTLTFVTDHFKTKKKCVNMQLKTTLSIKICS